MFVFLRVFRKKGLCSVITGHHRGWGGGVRCWDKQLNFELERQAAHEMKKGEEQEGLMHHKVLETSKWLFIIIQNGWNGAALFDIFYCFGLSFSWVVKMKVL